MAVAFRGAGTEVEATVAGTTSALPWPAGVQVGDLQVIGMVSGGQSATTFSTPSGWTQVDQFGSVGSTNPPSIVMYYKIADSTDATHSTNGDSLTVSHGSVVSSGMMIAFSGVNTTTVENATHTISDLGTAVNTTALPGATLTVAGCAVVVVGTYNNTTATSTPPAGFTEVADRVTTSARAWHMSYETGLAAGATGTITIGWSGSARNIGIALFINPVVIDPWTYTKIAKFGN